jgi:diguanylate cyclase (GGDEF)-like protein
LLDIVRLQTDIAKLGLDLGGVMSLVTERAQEITRADGAVIEWAERDEMVYRTASGSIGPHLGLRLKRDGSLSGLCLAASSALCCEDSETDARVDLEACRRVGLRSMVVVPLKHLDTAVGVLKVTSREADAFTQQDLSILALMSELVAAAMFHAAKYGESELYIRATHDSLTGLANRSLFYDRLRQAIHLAERSSKSVGVLNIDMDGLKTINDTHGHRAGDAAITETASRMKKAARRSDTVARIGGDEFALMTPSVTQQHEMVRQSQRLANEVSKPFRFEGHRLQLGISVGFALFPQDGNDINTVLECADRRMYSEKKSRKQMRAAAPGANIAAA